MQKSNLDNDLDKITNGINKIKISKKGNIKPTTPINTRKKKGDDKYTKEILLEQFNIHIKYVESRLSLKNLGIKFRLSSIPEDISENIIKFIIHKNGDTTSSWNCSGDLISDIEGTQECKCFT